MMGTVAKKATNVICAFRTQLNIFIGKELCVRSSEGKEIWGDEMQ